MNIFAVDNSPIVAARSLCDEHVRKMIVESSQMLSLAYSLERLAEEDCPRTQKGTARKHTHRNHPCSKWTLTSMCNWQWLLDHVGALCGEFEYRFDKVHFTQTFVEWLQTHPPTLPAQPLTQFVQAIKDQELHRPNPIDAYRLYYCVEKSRFATWTKRQPPVWYQPMEI